VSPALNSTAGIGHCDDVFRIGTYDATLDQLNQLEGDGVTVEGVQ
jgi:hypothetical protein